MFDKKPWKNCCYSIYKEKKLMFLLYLFVFIDRKNIVVLILVIFLNFA
jgi:hypothetical protein